MTLKNLKFEKTLDTQHGEKTIKICCCDVRELQNDYDLLVCSSFVKSYIPTPKSIIGALNDLGISIEKLSKNPEVDFRNQGYGVWLSHETGKNFHRISCVELFDKENSSPPYISDETRLKIRLVCFESLLKIALEKGIPCNTIVIPFLGIGFQGIEPCISVIHMLSTILNIARDLEGVKQIILVNNDQKMTEYFSEIFNDYFNSIGQIQPFVFISYSSKQNGIAQKISEYLNENGIDTWIAPKSIPSGSHYEKEIPIAIMNTSAVVLVLTPDAEESGWVCKEVNAAVSNNKTIIPCKIQEYPMRTDSNFRLEHEQILNAWEPSWDTFFPRLKDAIISKIKEIKSVQLVFSEKRINKEALHSKMPISDNKRPVDMEKIDTEESAKKFINEAINKLRNQIGNKKVLIALNGGIDSSVTATLLIKAIGKNLVCVHVNHGLLRKGEPEQVIKVFREQMDANLIYVDAVDRFLDKLAGVDDPEQKRKIIGKEFIDVFAKEAKKLDEIEFLAQGTIYPDILESAGSKAHHNAGGLPEGLNFELVEPVKFLYKDEVRVVGKALGLPDNMVYRQPFPGPGLGVRCVGAITRDRLEALREADAILREEFKNAGLEDKVWQYFVVVPDFKSTGIKDSKRTYEWSVIIRAVNFVDTASATIEEIPYPLLYKIRDRILEEVTGVNRVLYDISPKPVATIEYE